jgi:hypothetical protein
MISRPPSQRKAQTPATVPTRTVPEPWQVRSWFSQAANLYATPEAQKMALLHHLIDVKMALTTSPEIWRWCQELAARLTEEVVP